MEKLSGFVNVNEYKTTAENVEMKAFVVKKITPDATDKKSLHNLVMHTHTYIELYVCDEGEIKIEGEKGIYSLSPGDVAVICSGNLHRRIYSEVDDGTKGYVFGIQVKKLARKNATDIFDILVNIYGGRPVKVFQNRHDFCQKTASLFKRLDEGNSPTFALKLLLLLVELGESINRDGSYYQKNRMEKYDIKQVLELEHIISTDFSQRLSNKEIAARLNISERQLTRIVKLRYTKTLHQILNEKRTDVASKLLLETNMSIEKISENVGFGAYLKTFYKEFQKRYGMTPGDYRAKFK
jgi:AraC-like DNA-binding protein/mannose-6-phosphate isomerase-like protein (cupin superfamily)